MGSVLFWRDVAGLGGRRRDGRGLVCLFGFLLIFHVWIFGKVLHTEVSFPTFDAREIAAKYLVLRFTEAIHTNDNTKENKTCHSPFEISSSLSHNDLRHSDRIGFLGKKWNKMIGHQLPAPDSQYGANKIHWPIGRVNNVEIELQNPISSGVFSYFVSPSLKSYPLAHRHLLRINLLFQQSDSSFRSCSTLGRSIGAVPSGFVVFHQNVGLTLHQIGLFSDNLRRL